MSLKNKNFLFSILFIIITFRKINTSPPNQRPPDKAPNINDDEMEKELDHLFQGNEPPNDIEKNNQNINEIKNNINKNNNNNNNINNNNNNNKDNNNNINNNSNSKEVDISNKLKEINELKEKTRDISIKNDDSKNKLQKYHLYYYIMVILNIIFVITILLFIIYKIYNCYNSFLKKLNNNNLVVSIVNNDSSIIKDNQKQNERSITKSSFIIEGINNQPLEIESNDNNENVAPAVNGFN